MSFDQTSLKTKSLESLRAELTRLRKEMDPIKETLFRLREKAHDYRAKRNELHTKNKVIREGTREQREERDSINNEIQDLKRERNEIWRQIREQIDQIRAAHDEFPNGLSEKADFLEKREKELEWAQQTTPMTANQEKKIVEEIASINESLTVLRKKQAKLKGLETRSTDIENLKQKADSLHVLIQQKADESQNVHMKMLDEVREMAENQESADQHHQKLVKQMELIAIEEEKLNLLRDQYGKILAEVKNREQKIRETEMRSKKEKIQELRKQRTEKATKKMKSGAKLTFEEFFLLQQEKDQPSEESHNPK